MQVCCCFVVLLLNPATERTFIHGLKGQAFFHESAFLKHWCVTSFSSYQSSLLPELVNKDLRGHSQPYWFIEALSIAPFLLQQRLYSPQSLQYWLVCCTEKVGQAVVYTKKNILANRTRFNKKYVHSLSYTINYLL